ncbi:hypothetical protein B0H16DRAFT_348678 [Mycena metata]|uniref:Uncharacterized protein n=1 Tax=Mycena metata TaxID=1033252 RepID=A0AAD7MLE7_9AGAR|nr:hypothetical protein B0H16DRAFT_348678 [Mycena metata]
MHALIFRGHVRSKGLGLLPVIILLYILATIHVSTRWFLVHKAFIDQPTPLATATYLLRNPLWLTVLPGIALTLSTLIADCVLIWRCWAVWVQNYKIVALPIACTIAGAVLGFLSVAEEARYVINPALNRAKFVDYATPYFSLSLATTLMATISIIARIVIVTRRAGKTLRGYGEIIEITVESAMLYSVTLIVFLPLLVEHSFNDGYPEAVLAQMTGIAPTLIVARASFGLSRPEDSWKGEDSETTSIIFQTKPNRTINASTSDESDTKSEVEMV